jgi:hypothetical protein
LAFCAKFFLHCIVNRVASARVSIHNATVRNQATYFAILFAIAAAFVGQAFVDEPEQSAFALQRDDSDQSAQQASERGYENLLGEGLSGWEAAEGDAAACWKRDGDELVCTGAKGPWLRYGKPVKDFNLRLEYLLKEGGNSGVCIRVPADGNHHGEASGIEVQILDDASPRYAALKPYQYSGSLYAIVPADPRSSAPAGKWGTLEIDCKADRYIVWQNGVEVIRATGASAPELLSRRLEGYIGLQNHSEEVRFRNLRLGASRQ